MDSSAGICFKITISINFKEKQGKMKITRKKITGKIGSGVLIGVGLANAGAAYCQVTEKPNIIIIYADDLGYGDLGCYGATKVHTPNIDLLATQGRMFTDMHTVSAVSTPSRYALLTGEYPFRVDCFAPVFDAQDLLIDVNRLTIADVMKANGYATAVIGKWHLGFGVGKPDWNGDLKPGPLELGFDYYFGIPTVSSHPPFVYIENHRVVGLDPDDPIVYGKRAETKVFDEKFNIDKMGGAKAAHALYNDEMVGTTLCGKAVKWIKDHKDQPFFLYFPTTNIHHPFTPNSRFRGTSDAGRYGDFIHELDWIVGEVMKTLDEENLADNTLVIFTSDNGAMLNRGGQDAMNAGHRINGKLLGFKFDAWEGGNRVPMIVRWPGKVKAGTKSDQLISNVDMLHSIASLMGYKLKEGDAPDSYDMLPVLLGKTNKQLRDNLVIAAFKPSNLAIRQGDWILISARGGGGFGAKKPGEHAFGGPPALQFAGEVNSDIENGAFKPDAPKQQLYNLRKDLYESKNVIRQYPDEAKKLNALLQEIKAMPSSRQLQK
jgi:arylsulfatase A